MREIKASLSSELLRFQEKKSNPLNDAFLIPTFRELVEQHARLAYLNKDHMLFFRGQREDYRNKAGSTTLYPSIYRGDYVLQKEINYRFDYLKTAGKILTDLLEKKGIEGAGDVKRKQYIQWSILQHYEICQTPLLDLTASLRVACTFAIINNEDAFGYVYMLGLPYVTNRISVNSEHDIVNIRLLSICPPDALRPYFQEGYLAGTTDITDEYESKNELDFNNRLVAKFKIPTNINFWGDDFKVLPYNSLYPEEDPVEMLCAEVKEEVEIFFKPGEAGEFLGKWSQFENYLTEKLLKRRKGLNFNEALKLARNRNLIDDYALDQIEKLKRFRSELLYSPKKIKRKSIGIYIEMINSLLSIWSSKI